MPLCRAWNKAAWPNIKLSRKCTSLGPTRIALKAEILVCFGIHVEIPRGPSIYQPNLVLSL